jgi:hypothetical protein
VLTQLVLNGIPAGLPRTERNQFFLQSTHYNVTVSAFLDKGSESSVNAFAHDHSNAGEL